MTANSPPSKLTVDSAKIFNAIRANTCRCKNGLTPARIRGMVQRGPFTFSADAVERLTVKSHVLACVACHTAFNAVEAALSGTG